MEKLSKLEVLHLSGNQIRSFKVKLKTMNIYYNYYEIYIFNLYIILMSHRYVKNCHRA